MKDNSYKMHNNLKIQNWSTILLYSTLSAFFSLMPIKLIQYMIDSIKIDLSLVIISGIFLILFYLLSSITKGLNDFYVEKLALDVGHQLRVEMFNRILLLSYYEHKSKRLDEESSSLLEDVKIISENSIKPLSELLGSFISFILGLALVLTINPVITITLIGVGLLAAYVNKHFVDKYDKLIEKSRTSSDGVWKLFNDINKYFEEIITNRRDGNFKKLAKQESDKYRIEHLAETKHSRKMYAIDYVIFMSTIGVLYLITSILVYYGQMTMGGLVAIMMYNSILVDPLLNISKVIKEWRKVNVSLKRLTKVAPKIHKKSEKDIRFDRVIELKNINYIVNDKEILRDINMKIHKGEKVAIVGKSGSGKSTLIRILLGLIKPSSGSIIYDKYELDEDCNVLDNFSVLNQNCLIFNESLRKNLQLYTDHFDSEQLIKLIDRFGLNELFHENNIETRLDSVSGGEQKRIGLLRTLLRESNIYVFDELSNSLDIKNIDKAVHYIETELSDKTVIMVDHRTKDFDYFDNIYVLEEGMIVAKGSFQEIKSNEAFISMYNLESHDRMFTGLENEHYTTTILKVNK